MLIFSARRFIIGKTVPECEHMDRKLKFSFQIWGLLLFFLIMLPNFYSFAVPAPHDIFAVPSVTAGLDTFASICQVLMVAALCLLENRQARPIRLSPWVLACLGCCLVYYGGWVLYYHGVTNAAVILDLCIAPCLAFGFFAVDRKNWIATVPLAVFTACHLAYAISNFII